ncbi:MAG: aldo/keto reductase [Candidatus Latescibacteria bacterium]|jgi:aryl-alcohol dehydrogenase-like predicted oxidoreductase|nr:aldo/keto reductase [Candidatus Latescibacterota bacterium]
MEYITLGRTGLQVSPLCLGTWLWTQRNTPEEGAAVIDQALNQGINFIDTANVYARGGAEEVVGTALEGRRDSVVLATKVCSRMDDSDPNAIGLSRTQIVRQCENSLKRLKTDYIDLYQMHRPCPNDTPIEESLRAFDDLVSQGKVRYIGSSNFPGANFVEALWKADVGSFVSLVTEQPPYNILRRRAESDVVPWCLKNGVVLVPYSPISGGLLTGKYRKGQPMPDGGRLTEWKSDKTEWWETAMDVVERLLVHAAEKGCTLSQFSVAWLMRQPAMGAPIIGPRNVEQLTDNLGALDVEITDEDCALVDELAPPGRSIWQ